MTAGHNARYYRFTLEAAAEVTITLESGDGAQEPVLHLRAGASKTGTELDMNDGIGPSYTRAEIARNLAAGTYTVEARTYSAGHVGPFTLTVSVAGGAPGDDGDRAALVALYNATGGANWTNNDGWLTNAPIGQWHGVTTDDSGRVTRFGPA